jgi:hypothetical protein
MRKIFTLFAFVLLGLIVNAQYIYNDFDGNQNEPFSGDPNNPNVVANPDVSGINTSANVAEWVRGEGYQWAHVYTELDGKIDFSTGTTFQLKVYSPLACEVLFKLEDKTNQSVFVEVMGIVTTANQWELLTYDFSGAGSGIYDKVVIFFDFATTVDNTFYFDDVEGPEYGGGVPSDPVTLPVTFDVGNVNYGLTDFGGNVSEIIVDPNNADNNIAQTIKTEAAETWAGTTVGGTVGFPTPIPFVEGSTTMSVAVWSPTAGTPMRLKVEDSGDPTISVETEAISTVANEWEILLFDFSNEATGTAAINLAYSYNKASIFFNFGTTGAQAGEQTYYWDDMEFVGGSEPKPLLASDVQDNFENDGWATITDWKFQDPDLVDLTIITDPIEPTNHVAEYIRSGSFEWTNAQFILDHRMDLSERNIFDIRVYFPSSNNYGDELTPTAALKLQNSLLGPDAWTTQTEVKLTVEQYDEWITLSFDFSVASDIVDYDQVVVQFGGEGHFQPGLFYFDDIELLGTSSIEENDPEILELYPNPTNNVLHFNDIKEIQSVTVYNINGQELISGELINNSLNVSQLNEGLYFIRINEAGGRVLTGKFMKQ